MNWDLYIRGLILAFIIFVGGLMITPHGIECIACGNLGTRILGAVAIGLGVIGIATFRSARKSTL